MNADHPAAQPATLTLESTALGVARAIAELRQGREVALEHAGGICCVAALEMVSSTTQLAMLSGRNTFSLLLSSHRAEQVGLKEAVGQGEAVLVELAADSPLGLLESIAGLSPDPWDISSAVSVQAIAEPWVSAALTMATQARLAPALICHIERGVLHPTDRLTVSDVDVMAYPQQRGRKLDRASSARVPLAAHDDCEFIVWREQVGDLEHVAILVARPDLSKPVLTRVHSSCLTGDLFSSLRCDCGEQLQGAVERMAKEGGGVLLYLAQEGRGIGLVNKLRAYQLQDREFDTLEADRYLGFRADERDFTVASTMIAELGISQVRLLTNNPAKIEALRATGIDVVERVAINIPSNPANQRYMRTKHERAGHMGPDGKS
ncbi:MAG: GTP cyclohydrolase II [Burkholderiaceae bacterium]